MSVIDKLMKDNEFLAAGYFENESASNLSRVVNAYVKYFEYTPLNEYSGQRLWPCGICVSNGESFNRIVWPHYSDTLAFSSEAAQELGYYHIAEVIRGIKKANSSIIENNFFVGGNGYTHSIPNYGRILRGGLDDAKSRCQIGLGRAEEDKDPLKIDFYENILKLIDGIKVWHKRLRCSLIEYNSTDSNKLRNRDVLLEAFAQVPFRPARSFVEAVISYNFVFYLDFCDNQGCVDKELAEFYDRDNSGGILTDIDAQSWLDALSESCEVNSGWTSAIGGSNPDGKPFEHKLTELYIHTLTGRSRPNTELKINDYTSENIWQTAFDSLAEGNANPAFYNDKLYIKSIYDSGFCKDSDDIAWWCGCGCTETIIHGKSCVGSIDAGLNMPKILCNVIDEYIACSVSFDEFIEFFKSRLSSKISLMVESVNEYQRRRAQTMPQPIRSLLIDDCISSGKDYYSGGARYNGSNINFAGLANVADSLAAVKEIVFKSKQLSGSELLEILHDNFAGHEELRKQLSLCPKFGNDDFRVDSIAKDISLFVYHELLKYEPWRGGVFMPACIMFETYSDLGKEVGATPDGRFAFTPISDSIGPMQGCDTNGPTAMLKSVASLPQYLAVGTPVLNVRFARDMVDTAKGRESLKNLIKTYFDMGGMQIQISILDGDILKDAVEHPEKHNDLIVRIGGYSTKFNNLSDELKLEVIKRTEHLQV
ncbi:MAG: pyruvate formate lyase family protein [Sedimentisphaeraceae bacterium JB056]